MDVKAVKDYFEAHNVAYKLHRYSDTAANADEASAQLLLNKQQMLKTILVKSAEYSYYLCLIPIEYKLDLNKLTKFIGHKCKIAKRDAVKEVTGFDIGMVNPFFIRDTIPIILDATADKQKTIGLGSGIYGIEVELKTTDVKTILKCPVVDLIKTS